MKVTSIKPQVKRLNRYSIFIDNKYAFALSENELLDLNLKVGQSLDDDFLNNINTEVDFNKAKNSCFKLLSYRARSIGEVRDYLNRKDYDEEVIERTIVYLTSKAFLDDEMFSKQWLENRIRINQYSLRQIRSELRQKKVSDSIINKIIEDESIDEVKLIKQLIEKKQTQSKYKDELKLMQFLSRRGFSYDKIQIALGRRSE